MNIKSNLLFSSGIFILLLLFFGCESGHERSITGDFFDRKSGEFTGIAAYFDSLTVYMGKTGESSNTFTGRYRNVFAFTVVKFPQPSAEFIDNLDSAVVRMNVGDTWRDGDADFELFEAVSDWSDSVRLDPDMFDTGGISPVSIFSDTAASIGSLDFTLPDEVINNMRSWGGPGSFKVMSAEAGKTMVGLTSMYSNHKPKIEYIFRNEEGLLDTTLTECIETNYYFSTGFKPDMYDSDLTAVVSDAGVSAFSVKLTLPDSLPETAAINKCVLKLNIHESPVPEGDTFYIGICRLTEPMTSFFDAQYESLTSVEVQIEDNSQSIEVDITIFVNSWHKDRESNYGMLVKPLQTSDSPCYIICSPDDSLTVFYTSLPEVE